MFFANQSMSNRAAAARSGALTPHVSHTSPSGPQTMARASGKPTRSIRPASRRPGDPAALNLPSKIANFRLDEPPLIVRMHDRSGRWLTFTRLPVLVSEESDKPVSVQDPDETIHAGQYSGRGLTSQPTRRPWPIVKIQLSSPADPGCALVADLAVRS